MQNLAPSVWRASKRLHIHLYLVAVLVLLTFVALRRLSPSSAALLRPGLDAFPAQVGAWKGTDGRWEEGAVTALKVDDWLLRLYRHRSGDFVWLYLGFLEGLHYGKSHHSPLTCYPFQGWTLLQNGFQQISLPAGDPVQVNKLLVQKGPEQRLVLYWYQRGEEMLTEGAWQEYGYRLSALLRVLRTVPRRDSVLVRVSAPIMDSVDATLSREIAFIQAALPLLNKQFALDMSSL